MWNGMVSEGKTCREGNANGEVRSALGFPGAEGYMVRMGSVAVKLGSACEFGMMLRAAGDLCLLWDIWLYCYVLTPPC